MSEGIVYFLTHAAMPGFVKIGLMRLDNVSQRVKKNRLVDLPLPVGVAGGDEEA